MSRGRVLAALVACLAVFAAGLNVVAAAQASAPATVERDLAAAPCSHCDDCDKAPCPMPASDCLQMHANSGPALVVAAVELAASVFITLHWSPPPTFLSGLSRPPDPFPPRA